MSNVGIEISVNTDKVTEFIQDMVDIGKKYGIEPLIVDNKYIYFDFENLIDIESKGVMTNEKKMDKRNSTEIH